MDEHDQRAGQPRSSPEITRIDGELRTLFRRQNNTDQAIALLGAAMTRHETDLKAMSTHEVRLDRLEQRSLSDKESKKLTATWIGMLLTAGLGLIGLAVQLLSMTGK